MSHKTMKTWCLRLLPVLLFFISFFSYYCSYVFVQSSGGTGKSVITNKSLCGGWIMEKKWESLNFNISRQTQLFLKMEDFFWREHLSNLALPYGIKGSELLLLKDLAVIANYKMPANIENLPCRTCVIIGNGFAIKNSSLGGAINKYDVVIRLNDAPVRGYEVDVGNKTTMRLFYPESASYNPAMHNDPSTLMVLVPFKQQDLRWLKEILYNEKRVRKGFWKPPPQIWMGKPKMIRVLDPYFLYHTASSLLRIPLRPKDKQDRGRGAFWEHKHNWQVPVYANSLGERLGSVGTACQESCSLCVDLGPRWTRPGRVAFRPRFDRESRNKLKQVHPTTGILAVFMALNYCDVVHVAGFGYPKSKNQKHPIHYYGYDTMKSMKDSYHDLSHEAEALKRLEDSGAVLYLHPHT